MAMLDRLEPLVMAAALLCATWLGGWLYSKGMQGRAPVIPPRPHEPPRIFSPSREEEIREQREGAQRADTDS